MEDLSSIYTDVIMEHSTATYNKHELAEKTASEHGHNPSCGDDITLEVKMKYRHDYSLYHHNNSKSFELHFLI